MMSKIETSPEPKEISESWYSYPHMNAELLKKHRDPEYFSADADSPIKEIKEKSRSNSLYSVSSKKGSEGNVFWIYEGPMLLIHNLLFIIGWKLNYYELLCQIL